MEHTAPTRLAHPQASNNAASSEAPQLLPGEICYSADYLCGDQPCDPVLDLHVTALAWGSMERQAQGLGMFLMCYRPGRWRPQRYDKPFEGEDLEPLNRAVRMCRTANEAFLDIVEEGFWYDVQEFAERLERLEWCPDTTIGQRLMALCILAEPLYATATFLKVVADAYPYPLNDDDESEAARIARYRHAVTQRFDELAEVFRLKLLEQAAAPRAVIHPRRRNQFALWAGCGEPWAMYAVKAPTK